MARPGLQGMLLPAAALLAQTQPTFYAAWEDGLEAERQGNPRKAAACFRRAIALRPHPSAQVIIYGNNLLEGYFPYTHLGRCLLELGDLDGALAVLNRPEARLEPRGEREALTRRAQELKTPRNPPPQPQAPIPEKPFPAPAPIPPAAIQAAPPLPPPAKTSGQENPSPPEVRAPRSQPAETQSKAEDTASPPPPAGPVPAPSSSNPLPPSRSSAPALGWWGLGLAALLGAGVLLRQRIRRRNQEEDHPAFKDPVRIGPYRIERLLGRSSFASTFLARHEGTGARVALKTLHPFRHEDPEFLGRFRLEARLGSLLDHPNIARLVEPCPEQGPPWLATEFAEGQRLDKVIQSRGALPLEEVLAIASRVASAMAYAHARGVVHRDLKPANVVLQESGLKIMDFGIARMEGSETLTTTYAFLGTPLYAAPEAQLKTHIGPAADRYALGIMLFELLTGRPPFQGETPFEILDKHRGQPLPDLRILRPGLPEDLVRLVEGLCRKTPEERPEDAEVLATLDELARSPQGRSPDPKG
ncbi:MAG: protein kinase [Acidobacteria bacterium]|nr:protein kinase [Acidobacteriota bacterium]